MGGVFIPAQSLAQSLANSTMQAVAQRLRPQAFSTGRAAVPCRPCVSRVQHVVRPSIVRAAETDFDVTELGDDVDLTASSAASTPMASESVRLRIRMRGYDAHLLADAVEQIRDIAAITGSTFKGKCLGTWATVKKPNTAPAAAYRVLIALQGQSCSPPARGCIASCAPPTSTRTPASTLRFALTTGRSMTDWSGMGHGIPSCKPALGLQSAPGRQ